MIIEVKTIIPHQRANTRDPSIETPPFRAGRGHRLPSSGYNIAMTTLLYARQSPKRDTLKRTVVVRLLPRRGRG
jgi:hypothetical protein